MQYDRFHNCLRLQITMDDMQEERIDALVSHCVEYGFDNVMLMLNAEEFNLGHITLEEATPWIQLLKKAKKKLEEKGVTISVNNWIEIGHAERGRIFGKGQDFHGMVDVNGRESTAIACPLGQNWRRYYAEYIQYLVKELSPDTFWIEDDFRFHNHEPLDEIGCYCAEHMAYYNQKLGKNYTREEFVQKVFAPGPCNPERKVWLDANRDVMLSLAKHIVAAVKSADPKTDIALMSSLPGAHCIEGRDWQQLFHILGQGGNRIHRIHLCYGETSGKEMLYYFNAGSMAVRSMLDDDVVVMPEVENGSASLYARSLRFFRFVMESAIPLVLSGMTYSIYDFVGNGVRDTLGYGQEVRALRSYMQAIENLNLKFSSLTGVVVPIDARASYYKTIEKDYTDLIPKEYEVAAYLSGLGISYRYSREKQFSNETLFLCGSSADYFTDEQLCELFGQNYVILDGGGVLALQRRHLLWLIHAKRAGAVEAESGYQTYEECADGQLEICGIRKLRASCRKNAGTFVKVEYDETVCSQTHVYNQYMQRLAPAFAEGAGFAVIPYCLDHKLNTQFCDLRRYFVTKVIAEHTPQYAYCDIAGVSPYLYWQEQKKVLILLNGNVDSYAKVPLRLGNLSFTYIKEVSKQGEVIPIQYERKDDFVVVQTSMEYLSSTVLIFE